MAKKQSNKSKKKFKVPAVQIVGNIVFSRKEAWAYYKINTVPYDFLSTSAQADLANRTNTALATLASSAGKTVDCHVLITTTPFEANLWTEQMREIYKEWNKDLKNMTYFNSFINSQAQALQSVGFKKKVTYLGVKLFSRGAFSIDNFNFLEFGFKEAWEVLKKAIDNTFRFVDDTVTDYEIEKAISAEEDCFTKLRNGSLQTSKVSAEEILLINKRILHPSMPAPYLETDHENRVGLNDITLETVKAIEDNHRYLRMTQFVDGEEYVGYRATLSFSKFPKDMGVPSNAPPFMYLPTILGMPFTVNARFSLIPTEVIKKNLAHKKLETDDEIDNLAQSGQASNAHIQETLRDIATLDEELNEDKQPWITGSYRITIETPDETSLKEMIANVKTEFAEKDYTLSLTSGDQMKLLYEEMPGGELLINSFMQRTNLSMIGTSGFNYGSSVGDPINERQVMRKRGR